MLCTCWKIHHLGQTVIYCVLTTFISELLCRAHTYCEANTQHLSESLCRAQTCLESQTQQFQRCAIGLWRDLSREPDSAVPMLCHWAVERPVWRARLSSSNTEVLGYGETCLESQTQQFQHGTIGLGRDLSGEPDSAGSSYAEPWGL